MLPQEQIFTKYNGVWNLSAEQGNLGTFIITNVRIVWFAQLSENFNVSLPWIQVKCIRIRESKYGTALVLETSEISGNYVLGFKVEQVDEVYTEINRLFQAYIASPFFGVESVYEEAEKNISEVTIPRQEDQIQIVDTGYEETVKAQRQRYEIGRSAPARAPGEEAEIELNADLGLACERLPNGVTVD